MIFHLPKLQSPSEMGGDSAGTKKIKINPGIYYCIANVGDKTYSVKLVKPE